MPGNDWTSLERAWLQLGKARLGAVGAPLHEAAVRQCGVYATQRLQRAWEEGALPLRGVPSTIPETREAVDVPASEAGRLSLDCRRSWIVRGGKRAPAYTRVQVRKADVERLAREAGGNQAAAGAREQPVASDAQEADTKPQAVALWLRRLNPKSRPPGLSNKELGERVREAAREKLGKFSQRTLDRAVVLAWPRQTTPNRAKPRQTSR